MFCLFSFIIFLSFSSKLSAQPILSLTPVIQTGLSSPIGFVNAADGSKRVFIVQQGATIRVYDSAFNFLSVFLTVSNVNVGGERGLLSMAFHPDYTSNGFFYVYYTNTAGDLEIARYHVSSNANVADAASKVLVITIPHATNSNHNGGELHFGNDGYLYLSTGDGGGGGDQPNNAQNTAVLLGKILRFNVNTSSTAPYYNIPAGNPYNNEIFDLGLRNPYRWSFDRLTNDMWIGDVGQDSFEEIDYRAAGSTGGVNYGWHCYEGNNTYNSTGCGPISNYVFPAYTYPSQNPSAAITGGVVYRGAMQPALYGYYVAADFYSGIFYMITPDGLGSFTTLTQTLAPTGIVDFGETENGEAYVVSLISNAVYRLNAADGGPLPVTLANFTAGIYNHQVELQWKTSLEQNLQRFDVEYSTDGSVFTYAGTVQSIHAATGAVYTFSHAIGIRGTIFYRLKMIDADARYSYSNTVRIVLNDKTTGMVFPSVITDGVINIDLGSEAKYLLVEVVSVNGNAIIKRKIEGQTGRISIPAGELATGIYMVKLTGPNARIVTQKIMIQ